MRCLPIAACQTWCRVCRLQNGTQRYTCSGRRLFLDPCPIRSSQLTISVYIVVASWASLFIVPPWIQRPRRQQCLVLLGGVNSRSLWRLSLNTERVRRHLLV